MKRRRNFSRDFKLEVVRRSMEEDLTIKELSEQLSLHPSLITKWRKQYLDLQELSFPGHGVESLTQEQKRIRELERKLADAKMETEILKKAIRIFSKSGGKSSPL